MQQLNIVKRVELGDSVIGFDENGNAYELNANKEWVQLTLIVKGVLN